MINASPINNSHSLNRVINLKVFFDIATNLLTLAKGAEKAVFCEK
jgi:hypothetical protein